MAWIQRGLGSRELAQRATCLRHCAIHTTSRRRQYQTKPSAKSRHGTYLGRSISALESGHLGVWACGCPTHHHRPPKCPRMVSRDTIRGERVGQEVAKLAKVLVLACTILSLCWDGEEKLERTRKRGRR